MALRSLNNSIATFIDYLSRTGTDATTLPLVISGASASFASGNGTVYVFTSSSPFTVSGAAYPIQVFAVGGGGGAGGNTRGGGGGGGGMVYTTYSNVTPGTYSAVVGTGGAGSNTSTPAGNGTPSYTTLDPTIIAYGGGGGGSQSAPGLGNNGTGPGAGGGGGGGNNSGNNQPGTAT